MLFTPTLFAARGAGWPSLPATQMAAVLALQALHDHLVRETARAVEGRDRGCRRPMRGPARPC